MKIVTKIIFINILFFMFLNAEGNIKNIIVISSYHNSLKWDIDFTDELMKTTKKYGNIKIYKENLDSIRFDKKNDDAFYTYLKSKYENIKIDAIITISNPAFDFIEKYGLTLFGDIQFTSYSHEKRASTFTNRANISNEEQIKQTFAYALKQNPNTTNVIIIDQENSEYTKNILKRFDENISLRDISNFSLNEIVKFTSSIDNLSFIFYASYYKEPLGSFQDPIDVLDSIFEKSNIPIYSFNETYLRHGVIGGDFIDIKKLAKKILNVTLDTDNNDSNEIDISTTFFDEELMKEFNIEFQIEEKNLIKNADKFDYFLEIYSKLKKEIIIIVSFFLLILFLLLFTLYLNKVKRNKLIN